MSLDYVFTVDLFLIIQSSFCYQALECLVRLASVRRSVFSDSIRSKYLAHLMTGTKEILQSGHGTFYSFKFYYYENIVATCRQ